MHTDVAKEVNAFKFLLAYAKASGVKLNPMEKDFGRLLAATFQGVQGTYDDKTDTITIQSPHFAFDTGMGLYTWLENAFHEFGHSTGHPSRLARLPKRVNGKKIPKPMRALEECTAEIISCMLFRKFGLSEHQTRNYRQAFAMNFEQANIKDRQAKRDLLKVAETQAADAVHYMENLVAIGGDKCTLKAFSSGC